MPADPYSENKNVYTPNGYDKVKLRKVFLLVVGVFAAIILLTLTFHAARPQSQQDKYIKSATAAARKQTHNAKVKDVKVAGGFAVATVSDPSARSQAKSGNKTLFKVNEDGSMKQIADGSSFGPLDLLGLGIPLATQAKLTGSGLGQVKQNFASECGFDDGTLGYHGFDGSFSPGEWELDAGTLDGLEQALSRVISEQNLKAKPDKAVLCVNATQKNSDLTTDKTTYISTFTLQVQFITGNGALTSHIVTFAIGSNYYRHYTLDGQDIQ